MLALAAVNALAGAAFAAVYVAAGAGSLGQAAFAATLLLGFCGFTVLWVRVERSRPGRQDLVSRIGRVAVGMVLALVGLPVVVLMPLFFLREQLPPEAGLDPLVPGVMVALLASLALVAGVNLAGALYRLARSVVSQLSRTRPG